MKVLILLITGEDDEPQLEQEFINGYESSGLTWGGDITLLEDISEGTITDAYLQPYYNTGYELLLRNTSPVVGKVSIYQNALDAGMLFVSPVGSNAYSPGAVGLFSNKEILVLCGAGNPAYGNQSSSPCLFYDWNETESVPIEIADIRQCGEVYNLTHIQRRSATTIAFKISGITDPASIGLHLSGTLVYFSGLVGSDITLTGINGNYFACSFVGDGSNPANSFFWVDCNTGAGTINTGFADGDYQALSGGTMTFGNIDTGRVLIRTETAHVYPTGGATCIEGVSGFNSNITDGIHAIVGIPNVRGYFNQIDIEYDLNGGEYSGGAVLYNTTQSYSHAYIAGKLAAIKDATGEEWSSVIGRAIKTASGAGVRDNTDGYGVINVLAASDLLLNTDSQDGLDTPALNAISETTPGNIILTWNLIPFADEYEVYFRNELYATTKAHITTLTITDLARYSKGKLNNFKVRAINSNSQSEFSNEREYNHYYYSGIKVVDYA